MRRNQHEADRRIPLPMRRHADAAAVQEVDQRRVAQQQSVDAEELGVVGHRVDPWRQDRYRRHRNYVERRHGRVERRDDPLPVRQQRDVGGGRHGAPPLDPLAHTLVVAIARPGQQRLMDRIRLGRRKPAPGVGGHDRIQRRQRQVRDPGPLRRKPGEDAAERLGHRRVEPVHNQVTRHRNPQPAQRHGPHRRRHLTRQQRMGHGTAPHGPP